jgi:hypothetical protein
VDIHAFHLPALTQPSLQEPLQPVAERDGVRALAPALDAYRVDRICSALLEAQLTLRSMSTARVIAAIDAAAQTLRDPAAPARDEALRGMTAFTGYSHAMAERVLDRISLDWQAAPLWRLIDAEFGGADVVEGFRRRADGSGVRAVAPPLGLHVFAGNVPGVSVTSIVRALLVRSAVIGKSAIGEPVLAPVFTRLLASADPDVGACVAITYWAGGDSAIEAAVLHRARLVVHYGGADAIESLRSRTRRDTHFVEHGPRISFVVVRGRPAPGDNSGSAAEDTAHAVAMFDQQGCVSPQAAWVVGSEEDARTFAGDVARALEALADELPRGRLEPGEAAAIRELRTSAEFRGINGENVHVWEGRDLAYSVVYDPDPAFGGTCLNRTIIVRRAKSIDDVIERARPFGPFLQTVGVHGFAGETMDLATRLGEIGVTRITPIRDMPWPPVSWHHDGRGPLRELVRWIDLEPGTGAASSP